MMNQSCPRCGTHIPHDRFVNGRAFCDCGWITPPAVQPSVVGYINDIEKKTVLAMVGVTVVLVGLFAHFATWGSYGFQLPFVKLQQMTGLLSKSGYEELAKVCIQLGKYSCAKDAYVGEFNARGEKAGLANLARLQVRLGERAPALKTLEVYFQSGGQATESASLYGQLLEEANRTEEAIKAYQLAIANAGEILPVTATTNLVHILMRQGKYAKAYEAIEAFQNSAGNAIGYLNTEKAQLETYLHKQAVGDGQPPRPRRPANKAVGAKRIV